MNEMMKQRFYTVQKPEKDYKQKIRAHRFKMAKIISLLILLVILSIVGVYFYFRYKEYSEYTVLKSEAIETISEAEYVPFSGGVIKMSRDGATYSDNNGNQIWNQTYEMSQPSIDVCGSYVAIGSLKGNRIYILNRSSLQGEIQTEEPIRAVEVSEKGTVAVLTEGETSYKVTLYDKKSTVLARGEFRLENTGYPMAITLSSDGIKLGVSFVCIDGGHAGTRIQFYNFGSVGQNEIDNLVAKYEYDGIIVPQIEYLNKDVMVAYGTDRIILFEGEEKPQEKVTINLNEEIKTVFYTDTVFGVTYDVIVAEEDEDKTVHELAIYDLSGKEVLKQQFTIKYEKVLVLDDEEVAIVRDNYCTIYTFDGVKKFHGEMGNNILSISKGRGMWEYTFLLRGEVVTIRLK